MDVGGSICAGMLGLHRGNSKNAIFVLVQASLFVDRVELEIFDTEVVGVRQAHQVCEAHDFELGHMTALVNLDVIPFVQVLFVCARDRLVNLSVTVGADVGGDRCVGRPRIE